MPHHKIKINLPETEPEPAAVIRARELADTLSEPVFILDSTAGRNGAIPANQFRRRHFENAKILAVGYPARWQYKPRQHRGGDVR